MTDTDRLAALLRQTYLDIEADPLEYLDHGDLFDAQAARLIDAGVTIQPPAPAEGLDARGECPACTEQPHIGCEYAKEPTDD